jgi:4'-phosphopantetheinyl transferase
MHWLTAPTSLSLSNGDVHIWRVHLDAAQTDYLRLAALLSEDEHQRASRFHFESDRRRYVVGRGVLRTILSSYIKKLPASLAFSYGAYGKPVLSCHTDLAFNLAHSGALGLVAVTRSVRIGVDLELMRPEIDFIGIAESYFSPREIAVLQSLAPEHRCQCFYDCWTRKEAYIKALGAGLSIPLDRFDVTNAPGEPARLIADRAYPLMTRSWTLKELPVGEGYAAAAAVEATVGNWLLFDWGWRLDNVETSFLC